MLTEHSPTSRSECVIILLIVVGGFALRAAYPSHMAVEHFDEGVYASNLYCGHLEPPFEYPDRHLYAPPLWPKLLEWTLVLTGGQPASVMWANVVVGTLTIAAVWWVGRSWFETAAGLAAAALIAFSDVHILYSRTALTDPLLCLLMLLGIHFAWQAYRSGRPAAVFMAGLLAALTWWTKYNGWLTLAVAGSGLAAWLLFAKTTKLPKWSYAAEWLIITAIAAVGWAPVVLGLSDVGGYTAVAANHAGYFGGLGDWWGNFTQQADNLWQLSGWLTVLGLFVALVITVTSPPFARAGQTSDETHPCEGWVWTWSPGSWSLGGWLLAAWFIGLLVAVPLYRPYPRLTLPWLVACWLVIGALVASFRRAWGVSPMMNRSPADNPSSPRFARVGPCAWLTHPYKAWAWGTFITISLVLGGALVGLMWRWEFDRMSPAWQDRTQFAWMAEQLVARIAESLDDQPQSLGEVDAVVYVVGEPGLYYHLAGHEADASFGFITQPAGNLDLLTPGVTDPRVATFVVIGPHAAKQFPDFDPQAGSLSRVGSFGYRPSRLVRLNEIDAADSGSMWNVRCYRLDIAE